MAGAGAVDYSGAQSKRTLSTTQDWTPGGGQVDTAPTGLRHGKKTRYTPLGCRTTHRLPNGNGKRRRDNLLATSGSSRCDIHVIPGFLLARSELRRLALRENLDTCRVFASIRMRCRSLRTP